MERVFKSYYEVLAACSQPHEPIIFNHMCLLCLLVVRMWLEQVSGNHQEVVELSSEWSDSCQAVIKQLSGSHKTVILYFLVQPMRRKAFLVLFPVKNLKSAFFLHGFPMVLPIVMLLDIKIHDHLIAVIS